MKGKDHQKRQHRPRFGPGTLLAVGGAALLAASGWLGQAQPGVSAGQVAFEADAHGHLRRVNAAPVPPSVKAPLPPLWKPEPAYLLQQSTRLGLSPAQQQQIRAQQAAWQHTKVTLQRAMEGAAGQAKGTVHDAGTGSAIPLSALQQDLAGYSELSREYDARRAAFWNHAVSLLTPEQLLRLQQLEPCAHERGRQP